MYKVKWVKNRDMLYDLVIGKPAIRFIDDCLKKTMLISKLLSENWAFYVVRLFETHDRQTSILS